jgi:hypothetical protein
VIAGITLFGFGLGTAMLQPTSVAAAAVNIENTSSSATTNSAAPASSAAASSATPASSIADSSTTSDAAVIETTETNTSSATPASSAATKTTNSAASSASSNVTSAASEATSSIAPASSAAASEVANTTYQIPPVKSGTTQSANIAPTTAGSNKVTTSGTEFTVNFTVAAGDIVTVKVDGVDVSDTLYSGSAQKYASISNVKKANLGVETVTNDKTLTTDPTNKGGAIVNTITVDGSYSQGFMLKALSNYTYNSPTATAVSTETATKNIEVYINGALAASTDYTIDYNVMPVRVLSPVSYKNLDIYK